MNITARIERIRKEKAWSVAKLARETDIPTVSLRVMLGRKNVNNYGVESLRKIAEALETSVAYLTKEEEEDVLPKLTEVQKKELQEVVNVAIEDYFHGINDADPEE